MRPLLTADWRNLLVLNFAVPTEIIARLAPPGTEPDVHCGQSYVSIVGFQFQRTRLCGMAIPFHTSFPEINLRFYVRRWAGNGLRRGVVFVREIAPRRAVALVANRLYNESYTTRKMRISTQSANGHLQCGDKVEYVWHSRAPRACHNGCDKGHRWNELSAQVGSPFALPLAGSLDEFIIEHYWGYTRCRNGHTSEFRVAHQPWRIAPATHVTWNCHIGGNYDWPLAEYLERAPVRAIVAEGSPVEVFRGREI